MPKIGDAQGSAHCVSVDRGLASVSSLGREPNLRNMKITIQSSLLFLLLVTGFFLWFGGPQKLPPGSVLSQHHFTRVWIYCSLLFVVSAGTACFGDKEYGMFPPASLRWLFIIVGVLAMVAAVLWMHSIRESALGTPSMP